MAQIKPFHAFRYALKQPSESAALTSPPYDMIAGAQIDALYARNEHNVVRIIQNKSESIDKGNFDRHARAFEFFKEWIKQGVLKRDSKPALYGYAQRFSIMEGGKAIKKERLAIVSLLKLVEFTEGIVLPHEYTLSAPKQDRFDHMQALHANTELIFGVAEDKGDLFQATKACCQGPELAVFTDEQQVTHALYSASDPALIQRCVTLCAPAKILIADGHHRYETALRYYKEHPQEQNSHVMIALVSMADPGLVILPFHRLMRTVPSAKTIDVLQSLRNFFECRPCGQADLALIQQTLAQTNPETMLWLDKKSNSVFALSLTNEGRAFLDKNRGEHSLRWMELPMSVVNAVFVQGILGLTPDPTTLHDVIEYSKDTTDAFNRTMASDEFYGTFFLHGATMNDIDAIVKGGERMPQKSTNFFPKFYSGLLFNSLEER